MPQYGQGGFVAGGAERECTVDFTAAQGQFTGEGPQAHRDAVECVAEHHAHQRNGVLRLVPLVDAPQHHEQGIGGDDPTADAHREQCGDPHPGKAAFVARCGGVAGDERHHQQHGHHHIPLIDCKNPLQDKADKQKLHSGPHAGQKQGPLHAES